MGDKGVNEVFAGIFSIFGEFIHQNQNWDLCPQNQVASMEGEDTITIGCLFEYYHEISLTPLLGMFKCGNFRLDRHNDMIWRHDTDTCMQEAGQQEHAMETSTNHVHISGSRGPVSQSYLQTIWSLPQEVVMRPCALHYHLSSWHTFHVLCIQLR